MLQNSQTFCYNFCFSSYIPLVKWPAKTIISLWRNLQCPAGPVLSLV